MAALATGAVAAAVAGTFFPGGFFAGALAALFAALAAPDFAGALVPALLAGAFAALFAAVVAPAFAGVLVAALPPVVFAALLAGAFAALPAGAFAALPAGAFAALPAGALAAPVFAGALVPAVLAGAFAALVAVAALAGALVAAVLAGALPAGDVADPAAAALASSREELSRLRTRAVSSQTSSLLARPTRPRARSTSYLTRAATASRLLRLCATRSSASEVTCPAVASPWATSAFAAAWAFCRVTSVRPPANAR